MNFPFALFFNEILSIATKLNSKISITWSYQFPVEEVPKNGIIVNFLQTKALIS